MEMINIYRSKRGGVTATHECRPQKKIRSTSIKQLHLLCYKREIYNIQNTIAVCYRNNHTKIQDNVVALNVQTTRICRVRMYMSLYISTQYHIHWLLNLFTQQDTHCS